MTKAEAGKFGRTKIIKATAILFIILLIIFFLMETGGDFGNGFLFFMEAMGNIHLIAIMLILFTFTFILGGITGKEIILAKKNFIWTAIRNSIFIILAVIIYAFIIGVVKNQKSFPNNISRQLVTYFITPLIKTGSIAIIPLSLIWLWATNQMRSAGKTKTK